MQTRWEKWAYVFVVLASVMSLKYDWVFSYMLIGAWTVRSLAVLQVRLETVELRRLAQVHRELSMRGDWLGSAARFLSRNGRAE